MLATGLTTTLFVLTATAGGHPHAAPGVTTLTNPLMKFSVPREHFVEIRRGPVRIVVVDNEAVDVPALGGHKAGYNGVASLTHTNRAENLFVPAVAGLNFEHIHDGTLAVDKERFEPRRSPMSLRVIDEFTVEVYQPPTANWKLESCGRYQLLPDGTIEYTFECIPRSETFQQKYIGLFWASYIDRPEDKAIHFIGREKSNPDRAAWLRATTPRHGVDSTHPPDGPLPEFKIDPNFSLTLVNHPSQLVHTEPWYYGVSNGMAYVQMFRARDRIWFAQSPTGGGETNPPAPERRFDTYGMPYLRNRFRRQLPAQPAAIDGMESVLTGIGCCPGLIEGLVAVLHDPNGAEQPAGTILVAERTDPGWVPIFPGFSGILIERGSLLSHSAIVAREMGIPTIVGIAGLTARLRSGQRVRMDGRAGTIEILNGSAQATSSISKSQ